jgi:DNA-directed RNA polymerase sigma subunit (sigma70/sigma32)
MSTHILSEDSIQELHRVWGFLNRPEPRAERRPAAAERPREAGRDLSLEEVAQILGVTREAVRQVENLALKKCRAWGSQNGYQVEDLLDAGTRH